MTEFCLFSAKKCISDPMPKKKKVFVCAQGPFLLSYIHDAMTPKPYWILRHHGSSSIRSLHHAHGLLAIGDESGKASLVDLNTLRPRFFWTAHTDSILTVVIVNSDQVITHARDNSLKLWKLPSAPASLGMSALIGSTSNDKDPSTVSPELVRTIGVNALNFAKCSHLSSLLAVPNALDAAYIDILDLTNGHRTSEAVGRPDIKPPSRNRLPIVMSLHLLSPDELIVGYEDGYVKRWNARELVWASRCHSESVMSVSISDRGFGVSVGADDRVARFDLITGEVRLSQTRTAGKSSVEIAPDGETFLVGAWDGSITVYSASNMTRLGSLDYHRNTVECLTFATVAIPAEDEEEEDDDALQDSAQQLVLAAGGRDGKVSLWKYH
ncbi:hypothetical protein PHSY_003976 [Pseudozyma hubeiensis SY62]|uniref:ASTRA-associated protein 1 n=1 Tax=Pseudozyma hubeiensis (strain SY62) TaxID=1305764 RepID=R9P4X2_PSEHS|nr:hypothetical protein PHSY_003976 [Pseudozyma hubeiensis SY62]GAC96396.1 hypothetical protein PHSY_003976 [Pseudozyma hubeiensis SY62]